MYKRYFPLCLWICLVASIPLPETSTQKDIQDTAVTSKPDETPPVTFETPQKPPEVADKEGLRGDVDDLDPKVDPIDSLIIPIESPDTTRKQEETEDETQESSVDDTTITEASHGEESGEEKRGTGQYSQFGAFTSAYDTMTTSWVTASFTIGTHNGTDASQQGTELPPLKSEPPSEVKTSSQEDEVTEKPEKEEKPEDVENPEEIEKSEDIEKTTVESKTDPQTKTEESEADSNESDSEKGENSDNGTDAPPEDSGAADKRIKRWEIIVRTLFSVFIMVIIL